MRQKLRKQDSGFTQIKNEVLVNPKLSLKAKGVFGLIYSKPDDWDFSAKRLADETKDSDKTVRSALKELERFDYLKRKRLATGKVEYHIYYHPSGKKGDEAKKPNGKNSYQIKQPSDKRGSISNKEKKLKKKKINKERNSKISNFAPSVCKNSLSEDSEEEASRIYSKNINVNKILEQFLKHTGVVSANKWDRNAAYNMARSKFYKGIDNVLRIIDDYFKERKNDNEEVKYLPIALTPDKFTNKILDIAEYFKMNKGYNLIEGKYIQNSRLYEQRTGRVNIKEHQKRLEEAGGVIFGY